LPLAAIKNIASLRKIPLTDVDESTIGKTILYEILAGISKLIFARNTYFGVYSYNKA
jgi:hypothetical protein